LVAIPVDRVAVTVRGFSVAALATVPFLDFLAVRRFGDVG
jgi:hypothetical protein